MAITMGPVLNVVTDAAVSPVGTGAISSQRYIALVGTGEWSVRQMLSDPPVSCTRADAMGDAAEKSIKQVQGSEAEDQAEKKTPPEEWGGVA